MKIPNSKKNLRKLSCATVVAMTFVGLTGCRTQVKDVMKPLKDGNYEEAVSIFNEANWKDKEKNKFINEIKDYMSQLVSDYASGSITYEEVIEVMGTIADMQIEEIEEDFATSSGAISALRTSKIAYEDAMEMFEAGNYIGAISNFEEVIEKDVNHEDAQKKIPEAKELQYEKIKKDMLKIAEQFISAGDYISAIDKIKEFKRANAKDDADLDKIYRKYVEDYVTEITNKVNSYIKNKMYLTALNTANSAKNEINNEALSEVYLKAETEYVRMITEKVEGLVKEKDYLKAIEVLTEAEENVKCEKFTELMKKIEEEKPTYLSDLKFQNSSRFELIDTGEEIKDSIGNCYKPNGNLFEISNYINSWTGEIPGYVEYYLGYSYNNLHFNLAVDDTSGDVSTVLNVYGDGVVLHSINIDRKTVPTQIDIDISKVEYLTIKLEGNTGDWNDAEFFAIISDGYLE